MAFKLKTSKRASEIFDQIESSENLPCYTLVKLAMALSLRSNRHYASNRSQHIMQKNQRFK